MSCVDPWSPIGGPRDKSSGPIACEAERKAERKAERCTLGHFVNTYSKGLYVYCFAVHSARFTGEHGANSGLLVWREDARDGRTVATGRAERIGGFASESST